jgi:hypothetical protein
VTALAPTPHLAVARPAASNEDRPSTGPWSRRDLAVIATTTILGGGLLVVSWAGASGEVTLDDQLGWLALGVLGLFLVTLANARCILAGRRAVGRLRAPRSTRPSPAARPAPGLEPRLVRIVAPAPTTRFHRADCPLVAGKGTSPGPRSGFEEDGLVACGVCRP